MPRTIKNRIWDKAWELAENVLGQSPPDYLAFWLWFLSEIPKRKPNEPLFFLPLSSFFPTKAIPKIIPIPSILFYIYISAPKNLNLLEKNPLIYSLFIPFCVFFFWKVYSPIYVGSLLSICMQPHKSSFSSKNILVTFFECPCLSESLVKQ